MTEIDEKKKTGIRTLTRIAFFDGIESDSVYYRESVSAASSAGGENGAW